MLVNLFILAFIFAVFFSFNAILAFIASRYNLPTWLVPKDYYGD